MIYNILRLCAGCLQALFIALTVLTSDQLTMGLMERGCTALGCIVVFAAYWEYMRVA